MMKKESLLVLLAALAVGACSTTKPGEKQQSAAPIVDAVAGPGGKSASTPSTGTAAATTAGGGYLAGDGPGADAPQSRCDSRCRAQGRTVSSLCQPPLLRSGQDLHAVAGNGQLQAARHRFLVRQKIPRPAHFHRRDLRHVRHDRRASHAAHPQLCARHQSGQRQIRHRAHQRPRPLPA